MCALPRNALGMKVSDEFTVPLCSVHHDAVHRAGNEQGWWVAQAIDPLKVAAQLWGTSTGRPPEEAAHQDARSDVPNGAPPPNVGSPDDPTSPSPCASNLSGCLKP